MKPDFSSRNLTKPPRQKYRLDRNEANTTSNPYFSSSIKILFQSVHKNFIQPNLAMKTFVSPVLAAFLKREKRVFAVGRKHRKAVEGFVERDSFKSAAVSIYHQDRNFVCMIGREIIRARNDFLAVGREKTARKMRRLIL